MPVITATLTSKERPDPIWRLELRNDGLWLFYCGGLMLSRATVDQVARYLEQRDVDVDRDLRPYY